VRATTEEHYGDHEHRADDQPAPAEHDPFDHDHRRGHHHPRAGAHHHQTNHDDRTMSALATLLDLQEHDVRLDQLRHRRATLPDRPALAEALARRKAADAALDATGRERDAVAREQTRLEDEVARIAAKASAEDKKLYSGTVTAPKELKAIQDEIRSLERRRFALEDEVLAQMEAAEPLDAALAGLRAERAELDARVAEVQARLGADEQVLDADIATVQAERDGLAAVVDAGLLRQYDDLRRRLGGVAVAKLEGSSCRGCHLQLAAVELDRIRKLDRDVVVHCEECGRILVR
jgi:predicted  nucleic acid-binding Zn-ribbon protein